MRKTIFVLFLVAFSLACPFPVHAQLFGNDLEGVVAKTKADLVAAQRQRDEASARVAKLQALIDEDTGRIQATRDEIRQATQRLEEQAEQLQLDDAAQHGRREGIEQAIKKYTEMVRSEAESDPVVTALKKVVEARDAETQDVRQRVKAGLATTNELPAAEARLAQSQAELAAAMQRGAGGKASNEALEIWNRELLTLSIEAAERSARLQYVGAKLGEFRKAMPLFPSLDEANASLSYAEGRIAQDSQMLESNQPLLERKNDKPASQPSRPFPSQQ